MSSSTHYTTALCSYLSMAAVKPILHVHCMSTLMLTRLCRWSILVGLCRLVGVVFWGRREYHRLHIYQWLICYTTRTPTWSMDTTYTSASIKASKL